MSFDLMVFNNKNLKTSDDFIKWYYELTRWEEDRDYDNIKDTDEKLVSWFMEMKDIFPPLNGEFAKDDEEIEKADLENKLTDYCIAKEAIYCSFGWSVAQEAYESVKKLAKKHKLSFYDPQDNQLLSKDILIFMIRTNNLDDSFVDFEGLEEIMDTIDKDDFLTAWYENSPLEDFVQFTTNEENYNKKGLMSKVSKFLNSSDFNENKEEKFKYRVEVKVDDKLYAKDVKSLDEIKDIMKNYYFNMKMPDISDWEDTGIL